MVLAKPRSKSRSRRGQSGSVAIEFGFAALFFLLPLIVGTVALGLAVFQNMQVNAAVEAGALYALANGWDEPGIIDAVENSFGTTLTNQVSGVTASPVPVQFCGCPSGTDVANLGPPPCSTTSLCGNGNSQRQYIEISASLTRMSVVPNSGIIGLPPTFRAKSVVRFN